MLKFIQTESGCEFITLYMKDEDLYNISRYVYSKLKRSSFPYMNLQRLYMSHIAGDVERFHTDGLPRHKYEWSKHIHILYPGPPKVKDWEFLYKVLNDKYIELFRDIPHREVISVE